jgi:iron complex outermembrane receptor protein
MQFRETASFTVLAITLALGATPAFAQDSAAPAAQGDDIIVTGTRVTGLRAADSPAPIQLLSAADLSRTGQPDLIQALAQNLPSVQAQAFGSDLQAHNLQMKLRGLSPNHTLILLNGKRRHGTANVSVAGGPYGGSAAPDISFILPDSIDHIEVLQDGAAAQ